ncbi:family 16 glycosylhydrolase [Microvirga aerilata]|uniref:family 16 glycosylhydrolase n=1 Tax=Microvirga aerilata TaxID=670292 RepID=UPI003627C19B
MTFSEEFSSLATFDGYSGVWDTSRPWAPNGVAGTNGELQWYVNPNHAPTSSANPYSISDGVLHITAAPASSDLLPALEGQTYTSGMLTTFHSFAQTYGYFEIRAQLPSGQGLWPAFWLLPLDGTWPPELDVMEMLGHDTTTLHTTVHSQLTGTKQIDLSHYQTSAAIDVADMSIGFHTYGVNWQPDYITWYFDGQEVFQVVTPSDMHRPMYLIANLAVGGEWPGSPDATTKFPATMQIDYIRAYTVVPGGSWSPPPAPVSQDTLVLRVSADLYQGSPHFLVTVNGQQVGNIQTTHAVHNAGEYQDIVIHGNFGSGPHAISIQYYDDFWGGSWEADRNLYIHHVSMNGQAYSSYSFTNNAGMYANDVTSLYSNGTATFLTEAAVAKTEFIGGDGADSFYDIGTGHKVYAGAGNDYIEVWASPSLIDGGGQRYRLCSGYNGLCRRIAECSGERSSSGQCRGKFFLTCFWSHYLFFERGGWRRDDFWHSGQRQHLGRS